MIYLSKAFNYIFKIILSPHVMSYYKSSKTQLKSLLKRGSKLIKLFLVSYLKKKNCPKDSMTKFIYLQSFLD